MVVRDLMSRHVISVDQNATLRDAARLMLEHDVGAVCVVNGTLVGVVTARDLALKAVAQGWHPSEHPVSEVMSRDPVCAPPELDVLQASDLMAHHKVRRLPVCEKNQIVGMVSLADIADYTRRCLDNLAEETMAEK
jgi:CBS domain-containing protein